MRNRCDGIRMVSEYMDVLSGDPTTVVWNPVMLRVDTASLRELRFGIWLSGNSGVKVRPAIGFSNDGVTFTDAEKEFLAGYVSNAGWNFASTWYDVWALAVTRRLYARIGVQALTLSGTLTHGTQMRLMVEGKPFTHDTSAFGPMKVHTVGSTSTRNFCPMSEAIPTARLAKQRVTLERFSSSGDIAVSAAWQETDTPEDSLSWSAATLVGTDTTANGITFGTEFTAIVPTKRYLRWGASCKNISGTALEACRVILTIDTRD